MNLQDFWMEHINYKFLRILEETDLNLTEDSSEYVYVDGEEGDYGEIRYSLQGTLIATKVVEGGDCSYLELTDDGKKFLISKVKEILSNIEL